MQSSGATTGIRSEVVFVDTRIEGYETIVSGVDPHAEVVLIDASRDGFAQMAEALAGRAAIDAVHIVGHGEAGVVRLGSALLHADNLDAYAGDLGAIGRALAPHGDIQLWGCEVGLDAEGQALIQALAAATGADVAASNDLTGAGGDWTLEVTTGDVAASEALDTAKLGDFHGNLSGVGGTIAFATADGTALGATVTDGAGGSSDIPGAVYEIFTTEADGTPTGVAWRYFADTGIGADGIVADDMNGDPVVVIRTADGSEFSFEGIRTGNFLGAQSRVTFEGFRNGVSTGSVTLDVDDQITGIDIYTTGELTPSVFQNVDEVRITNPDIPLNGSVKTNVLSYDDIVLGEPVSPPSVSGDITVPANATYAAGQTLSFTVTFDQAVTVTGTDSTLGLTVGAAARSATYASKTATSVTYTYTVQAGDADADGIAVGGVTLNSSTIRGGGGGADADVSLTGHLPSTAGVLVDTSAPEVAGVSVPSNATYAAGQNLDFTVTFDENVTVTGSDSTLGLTVGSTSRSAAFLSSTGAAVTYRYTAQAGETDADGITVGALSLGASTIRDAAGNNAVLTLNSVGSTASVLVDAEAPSIQGAITLPADQIHVLGEALNFTLTFDENVSLSGAPSTLDLVVGGAARSASITGTTANSITYSYTVQDGDADADGIAVGGVSLNGGTIRDAAGNDADLTLTGHVPSTAGVLVDGSAPTVAGDIAVPANGSYAQGDTLTFTVTFDENIAVTGTDSTLALTVGSTARDAAFVSKTANSITYSYSVQAGDADANGIAVGGITVGTTTITDGAGNDADLSLTGHVPSTAGVLVDTTAPSVASVSVPSNATYAAGQNLDFTVTFDENVTVAGSDSTLGLTIGSEGRSAAFLSSTGDTVTYRYTIQAGETDADGISVGSLLLNGDVIRDAAGNDAVLTLNSVGSTAGVLVDADVPAVTGNITVPASDTYIAGETLNFTVTFGEAVTVTGADSTLGLTIGSTSRDAAYASKTANSITYAYTVQAGDADANGVAVGAISLGTSTIRDLSGNDANLALSGHVPSTAGVLVDTAAPSFVSATVDGSALVMTYSDASPLDAAHASGAGAFTVMAGGAPVSVTAVAVNGAANTVTLTLASPVAAGTAVTVAYADPTGGDDAGAVQDVGGNDAASLIATNVTNNTPTPTPPPTPTPTPTPQPTEVVDGVSVTKVTSSGSDGTAIQVTTVPIVTSSRVEQVGGNQLADIPLVQDASGAALLTLQVPVGIGLEARGSTQPRPAGNSLTDLIREIKASTIEGSQAQSQLTGGGTGFLSDLDPNTPMVVQTIVTTGSPGAQPLTISGNPQGPGQPQTALVIDTRSQGGIHIELQNVEFAAVIGDATVTGGAGSQHVWGDGGSQTILLGADDDALNGGGGNDTVGSAGGDDRVRGDDGDDDVFGGAGNDLVHGNAGADTARGDAGDDRVYGGKGDDRAFGGEDHDQLFGDLGSDSLQGNSGRDTVEGGDGGDVLYGGQDNDLLFGGADGDLQFGDNGDDVLQGNVGADTEQGGAGNDVLHGGRDNDMLFGGEGDDLLLGDHGDDILTGGAGADLFVISAGGGRDRVLDFNAAEGDRVGLLAGTTYSVAQDGVDTVITLAGGAQITLADVQLSSLDGGWITTA